MSPVKNNSGVAVNQSIKSIFVGLLLLAWACIHFSPAIPSISLFCAILIALFSLKDKGILVLSGLLLLLFLAVSGISIIHGCRLNEVFPNFLVRIPLVFIPVLWQFAKQYEIDFSKFYLWFTLPLFWLGWASVINFGLHYEFLSQMVLESKPVPIYSMVYHIEFSVMIALNALILLVWIINNRISNKSLACFLLFSLVVILHVLSARTGLLGFYGGLVIVAYHFRSKIKIKHIAILVASVIAFALFVPSINNRIRNTAEDAVSVAQKADLNHKSFGQRWEAWKAVLHSWRKSPVFGVGQCNIESSMQVSFAEMKSNLTMDNRISPHNQYLQWLIETGGIGFLLQCLFWMLIIITGLRFADFWMLFTIAICIVFALVFESLLERQAGVLAIVLSFLMVVNSEMQWVKKENSRFNRFFFEDIWY